MPRGGPDQGLRLVSASLVLADWPPDGPGCRRRGWWRRSSGGLGVTATGLEAGGSWSLAVQAPPRRLVVAGRQVLDGRSAPWD